MIRKVKWNNHPILGNLELDFGKPDGTCYNTIFLVGKNGCGKSTILDTISDFLSGGSFNPFAYIEYDFAESCYKDEPLTKPKIHVGQHKCTKVESASSSPKAFYGIDTENLEDIRNQGVVCSKARTGYIINPITSTKTSTIDSLSYTRDASNDATNVCQLIVDIYQSDSNKFAKMSYSSHTQTFKEFLNSSSSQFGRFSKAFNSFSGHIKFDGVEDGINTKKINFKIFEKSAKINDLSTGEQQIILRGTHLLQNLGRVESGHVFIDEPELSMHPSWEYKISKYYRDLFTIDGKQKAQIFFSTHSRYVIKSAVDDRVNCLVIVLRRDRNNQITAEKINDKFDSVPVTDGEIMYKAFDYYTIDYLLFLYGKLSEEVAKLNKKQYASIDDVDAHITKNSNYDARIHEKMNRFKNHLYHTWPTYIRNAVSHSESKRTYGINELIVSIELLIKILEI